MSNGELEDLKSQIKSLKDKVNSQSILIAKTGQQVIELQISNKQKQLKLPSNDQQNVSGSDFVQEEDIINLVAEMQQQLDLVEERSIRRGINLNKINDDDLLAPLPDADGTDPPKELWTRSLRDFKTLTDKRLIELCSFYQLLPSSDENKEQIEDFIAGKIEKLQLEDDLNKEYSQTQLDDLYDNLARYLGITSRRNPESW